WDIMRYWYAYTGESLILGHGRAIRRVISDVKLLQPLLEAAEKHYAELHQTRIPKDTFIAALLAPLAVQELGTASPATPFSSIQQMMRLFDGLDIEQVVVNLFNGRVASAFAAAGD